MDFLSMPLAEVLTSIVWALDTTWRGIMLSRRHRLKARHSASSHNSAFSTEFEALNAEHGRLTLEVSRCLDRETENFKLLIAGIAALLASAVAIAQFSDLERFFESNTWALLPLIIVTLWFPINAISIWADLSIAAAYLVGVLTPKMNAVTRRGGRACARQLAKGAARSEFPETNEWENFRRQRFLKDRRVFWIMLPIWCLRSIFLFFPAAALGVYYLWLRSQARYLGSPLEDAVGALVAGILMFAVLAVFTTANLVRTVDGAIG